MIPSCVSWSCNGRAISCPDLGPPTSNISIPCWIRCFGQIIFVCWLCCEFENRFTIPICGDILITNESRSYTYTVPYKSRSYGLILLSVKVRGLFIKDENILKRKTTKGQQEKEQTKFNGGHTNAVRGDWILLVKYISSPSLRFLQPLELSDTLSIIKWAWGESWFLILSSWSDGPGCQVCIGITPEYYGGRWLYRPYALVGVDADDQGVIITPDSGLADFQAPLILCMGERS